MQAVVFTDKAAAYALAAKVDAALGYPRDGVDDGSGIHVPDEQGVTLRYAEVRQHPDGGRWAYPVDATSRPFVGAVVVEALDASWDPA